MAEFIADYHQILEAMEVPFTVEYKEECGKFVVASRDLEFGEEIMLESPLCSWPIGIACDGTNVMQQQPPFCEYCLKLLPRDDPFEPLDHNASKSSCAADIKPAEPQKGRRKFWRTKFSGT